MFHVVTGGSGSGKSAYAEEAVCRMKRQTGAKHLYYIATMFPYGEETRAKIERHRHMRAGKGFETVECFTNLSVVVKRSDYFSEEKRRDGICVLLECMSNLVANELYMEEGAGADTAEAVMEGISFLKEACDGVVVVTNEVFSEGKPETEEMRQYCRILGEINCRMGHEADEVTEVVYGIEVKVKR